MNYRAYACIFLVSYGYAQRTLQSRLESAIEMADFRKVRALVKKFNTTKPSIQEKKDLFELLALTASDVSKDREEKRSLVSSPSRMLTLKDYEKAQDLSLGTLGLVLASFGAYRLYTASEEYKVGPLGDLHEHYGHLVKNAGLGSFCGLFGTYLATRGFRCSAQKASINRVHAIENYFKKLAVWDGCEKQRN